MMAVRIISDQIHLPMGGVGPLFLEVPPIEVWGSGFCQRSLCSARGYGLQRRNG